LGFVGGNNKEEENGIWKWGGGLLNQYN